MHESPYHKAAEKIADLVVEKQQAYGRAFDKAGRIMAILYPEGAMPEQMQDVAVMVRILDKFSRVATDAGAFGEDPRGDILGYALLWATETGENNGKR